MRIDGWIVRVVILTNFDELKESRWDCSLAWLFRAKFAWHEVRHTTFVCLLSYPLIARDIKIVGRWTSEQTARIKGREREENWDTDRKLLERLTRNDSHERVTRVNRVSLPLEDFYDQTHIRNTIMPPGEEENSLSFLWREESHQNAILSMTRERRPSKGNKRRIGEWCLFCLTHFHFVDTIETAKWHTTNRRHKREYTNP